MIQAIACSLAFLGQLMNKLMLILRRNSKIKSLNSESIQRFLLLLVYYFRLTAGQLNSTRHISIGQFVFQFSIPLSIMIPQFKTSSISVTQSVHPAYSRAIERIRSIILHALHGMTLFRLTLLINVSQ